MRALVSSEVRLDAPARGVWSYVTDWPRQGEWIPLTRVEAVPAGSRPRAIGGRIRAWTGLGPIGFWDPMTITAWEEHADGAARCEVLHTGRVVRGDAEFSVEPLGPSACRFRWWEQLAVPGGPVGAVGAVVWKVAGPLVQRGVDAALRRLARQVEQETAAHG